MEKLFIRLVLIGIPLAISLFYVFRYVESLVFDLFEYRIDRVFFSFAIILIIFKVFTKDLKMALREGKRTEMEFKGKKKKDKPKIDDVE